MVISLGSTETVKWLSDSSYRAILVGDGTYFMSSDEVLTIVDDEGDTLATFDVNGESIAALK